MSAFTGVPELDENILLNLSPNDVFNACSTNWYLKSICNNDIFWQKKVFYDFGPKVAALKPNTETYQQQYLRLINSPFTQPDYKNAVDANELDTLQWFNQNDITPYDIYNKIRNRGTYARDMASIKGEEGNIPFLQWLITIPGGRDLVADHSLEGAVGEGQIETLQWMQQQGIPFTQNAANIATVYGQLQVLQWLVQQGIWPSQDALEEAEEEFGITNTVEWLRLQGYIQ